MDSKRFLVPSTIVLLSTVITPAVLAQDVAGKAPSFEALPLVLEVGQLVKVRDDTGRTTRGELVSLSNTELVVERRQYLFPLFRRGERRFAKETIRSIDVGDSPWNGVLIGAAAGAGLLAVLIKIECSSPSACADQFGARGRWELGMFLFIPVGAIVGHGLDEVFTRTIYERPPRAPLITVAPLFDRHMKGVQVRLGF